MQILGVWECWWGVSSLAAWSTIGICNAQSLDGFYFVMRFWVPILSLASPTLWLPQKYPLRRQNKIQDWSWFFYDCLSLNSLEVTLLSGSSFFSKQPIFPFFISEALVSQCGFKENLSRPAQLSYGARLHIPGLTAVFLRVGWVCGWVQDWIVGLYGLATTQHNEVGMEKVEEHRRGHVSCGFQDRPMSDKDKRCAPYPDRIEKYVMRSGLFQEGKDLVATAAQYSVCDLKGAVWRQRKWGTHMPLAAPQNKGGSRMIWVCCQSPSDCYVLSIVISPDVESLLWVLVPSLLCNGVNRSQPCCVRKGKNGETVS